LHNIYLQILSRYKNIDNIIHYVEAEGLAEIILDSEPHTLSNIATRFTIKKLVKKIGKKK